MNKILVIGAAGQIGSELVPVLRARYGDENVVAAFHERPLPADIASAGPTCRLDAGDRAAVEAAVRVHAPDTVFQLAAMLSATAETDPQFAWSLNTGGLINVLEACRASGTAVFFPSSIGAFGPSSPAENTPQDTIQQPTTMYGITKLAGELLCNYYYLRYGVDTRGLRYPGLISARTAPGGGTTDYAVHIFHAALRDGRYTCFLRGDTRLDMMYMPDALRAAIDLMEADATRLVHRNGYNITAMSVTPEDIAAEIRRHLPGFEIDYVVDPVRQAIADSWPRHMDDAAARLEWGWQPAFGLGETVAAMLREVVPV